MAELFQERIGNLLVFKVSTMSSTSSLNPLNN